MNNFWQRLTTGVVFTTLLVGCIWLSGWYLHVTLGVIGVLTLQEFYKLFEKSPYSPDHVFGPILGFLLYFFFISSINGFEDHLTFLIGAVLLIFPLLSIVELFRKKKTPFQNIGLTILGYIYILVPLMMLNIMAETKGTPETEFSTIFPVLAIFLIVWANDTFAYLIGKQWGKRKLFERISPKKSWEGFFGGLLFALICGNLIAYFLEGAYLEYTVYALIISIIGTLGDLIESMLKRSLGVKDSGKILPGHGGLLDRLDAILFAIPFIFVVHGLYFS